MGLGPTCDLYGLKPAKYRIVHIPQLPENGM